MERSLLANVPAKFTLILSSVALLAACSGNGEKIANPNSPPSEGSFSDSVVVKSRFLATLSTSGSLQLSTLSEGGVAIPIAVINAPNVQMAVDSSKISIPSPNNNVVSLGSVAITDLIDNDLKKCGKNENKKCSAAVLRIYTTGTPVGGLYNSDIEYGAPMSAQHGDKDAVTIGLDPVGAAVMQTISIPNNKHVLRLSDFGSTALYKLAADFTQAGAGNYSTTLVVEYGLIE